jgi:hypothetical protein
MRMGIRAKIDAWLEERYSDQEFLICDGLETAFCGVVERFGQEPITCFDMDKIMKIYRLEGMSTEEAIEWFDFNVIGAWVGKATPCFLTPYSTRQGKHL